MSLLMQESHQRIGDLGGGVAAHGEKDGARLAAGLVLGIIVASDE